MAKKLTYLDFELAVKKSLEFANPTKLTQMVSIADALGRVLSKDIVCQKNLPAFDNSAMDGFAYDIKNKGKTLKIKQIIYAGDKGIKPNLAENECYKIMTGAKVPSDANTIIPIEKCLHVNDDNVSIPEDEKKGSNLRLKGEELKVGSVILQKGEVLNSSSIALLASQGIVMVEVFKKLNIAIVSTGNEIKEPWERSDDEEIYNCNSFALLALLKENGFEADYCGVVPDSLEKSISYIGDLKNYDVIITSGGISFGDADFMYEAFLKNGLQTAFHGVNIKPGRPIMVGKMDKTFVMCLPGNPLTALVNMRIFGLQVLSKMQGSRAIYHDVILAKNLEEFKVKKGRVNIVLGNLKNGGFKATQNNKYGSGMITAFHKSNALLVSDEESSCFKVNQEVFVIGFDNKLLDKKINILN
ncbi:MAG: molybdopterin molybdenumtransferase MoeA [Proteobacteria bacterium]|nr:MAG: molybdopterin molybdenumtransferase MoeA [Pseudomonadota bacterium]